MTPRRLLPIAFALLLIAPPALAQQASPRDDAPRLRVDLRLERSWFGPATPLQLELIVAATDEPATNLRATVALFERVRSRSQLRQLVNGRLPRTPLEAFTIRLEDLGPRASQRIRVEKGFDALRAFQGADDGVYLLAVTLRRATGPVLRTVATGVAFITDTPQAPLQVLPVVRVAPRPLVAADGAPIRLADERLSAIRRGLGSLPPDVPIALAVSPLLVDELRMLRDTELRVRAEAVEESLHEVATRASALTVPHTQVDLSHARDLFEAGAVRDQLAAGAAILRRFSGAEPRPLVLPPGLALDDASLASLRAEGMRGAIVEDTLPAAARGLTPADPVSVATLALVPADGQLDRAASRAASELDEGRVTADLAMVHYESPGRTRLLALVLDAEAPRTSQLLAALRDLPVVSLVSTDTALDTPRRKLRSLELAESGEMPRTFTRSLDDARDAVAKLAAFTLDGNPTLARLRTALLAGAGTAWWADDWSDGVAWNRSVVRAVAREQSLVSAVASAPVTFTARRGRVPVTVVNRAAYPVRVRVHIQSAKLRFPAGASRLLDPLNPPGELVTFDALTDATGTFPLTVRVTSPDGRVLVDEDELVVRSTALNAVALALTLGAAGFLVFGTSRRLFRRSSAR